MNQTQIEKYEQTLRDLERRLLNESERSNEALTEDVRTPGELSGVPAHSADADAEGVDAEITLHENQREMLQAVQAAILRIEEGTFGKCQNCGKQIIATRLKAIPYTPYCLKCEEAEEQAAS